MGRIIFWSNEQIFHNVLVMKKRDRYDTSGLIENQYQPGSQGRVLKNLRGISKKREMDLIEAEEYYRALEEVTRIYDKDHRFLSEDVRRIHQIWLGNIYKWAGQYRQVNLSKGGFPFAMTAQIPKLMDDFEHGPLKAHTPCKHSSVEDVVESLAIVHAEVVLIHPFRDGNGRVARLLAVLMALQAGFPLLDFGGIAGKKKKDYIKAIHTAMDRDYEPMREIFISVLRRTLRKRERL